MKTIHLLSALGLCALSSACGESSQIALPQAASLRQGLDVTLTDCAPISLIAAINNANAAGAGPHTITLMSGCTYRLGAPDNYLYGPNGLPAITSDITIDGTNAGAVIDRGPTDRGFRLFYVAGLTLPPYQAGALTLKNLTLRFGAAKGGDSGLGGGGMGAGGAAFVHGTLTLLSVTLDRNTAQGGNSGAGSNLSGGGGGMGGNGSQGGGGFRDALGTDGGPGDSGGEGGWATGGFGGGGGGGGNTASETSTPTWALGGFGGGRARIDTGGGGMGAGGAIFVHLGTLTAVNSTFVLNAAHGGDSAPASSQGDGGSGYGGAIFNLNGTVTLVNSTLAGNSIGGGIGKDQGKAEGAALYVLSYGAGSPSVQAVLRNSILFSAQLGRDLYCNQTTGSATVDASAPNIVGTQAVSGCVITGTPLTDSPAIDLVEPPPPSCGPSPVIALADGSPAKSAGDPAICNSAPVSGVDQRGLPRGATACSLGAVEAGVACPPASMTSPDDGTGSTDGKRAIGCGCRLAGSSNEAAPLGALSALFILGLLIRRRATVRS